ncbi:hypothetical protein LARV_02449 [Longilinea arvoryzae]|uniref:Uncharacterized protein n=1 Tax=Longilinea arvoryzae TaxID=360412 RepID=A0A0S7BJB7_9CHLR|nr:hypothetical protein [Longilinea arvoryzae]GAP14675.1 hypothetical protein LARV_02449 [Longilinea arvoryzae]
MARILQGCVTFTNGVPAQNVEVRVFDQDAAGNPDDDLTLTVGLSDSQGNFEVTYDPGRFRDAITFTRSEPRNPPLDWTLVRREHRRTDWLDIFSPYLKFSYSFQGKQKEFRTALNWFTPAYTLPQVFTDRPFSPTRHGYHFVNQFKGVPVPFSIPEIPGLVRLSGTYGLCGGMSSSVYDHYLFGQEIPQRNTIPRTGSVLQRYLYRRQMDTFGTLGEYVLKFIAWMKLPDETEAGLSSLTWHEYQQFRERLESNLGSVLGIIYEKGTQLNRLFLNHQVLGYGLDQLDEDRSAIRIYDPNFPDRDDVTIRLERRRVGESNGQPVYGLACEEDLGDRKIREIHGFFLMPYIPIRPPQRLA